MKILDVLQENAILLNLVSKEKIGVLGELVAPLARITRIEETDIFNVLMERERLGSTGIGGGVGIPHCKFKGLKKIIMGFGLSHEGVEFESIDGKLTYVFFLLVTPEESADVHLKLLARLSRLLSKEYFKNSIAEVKTNRELINLIKENDHDS